MDQNNFNKCNLKDRCSVGPDLGPNYLQRLSADDKRRGYTYKYSN